MANVYSAEYTNALINNPPVRNSAAVQGGRVRIFRATYTQGASAGSIGDVVYFGKLPAGATPLPFGNMCFSAGAATATLKLGLAGDDACFVAATAITSAGNANLEAFAAGGAVKGPLAAETDVIGTNATAAIAAGQKITVWMPYVMND